MAWKNRNTVNFSGKGLWKDDIFDLSPEDALRDAEVAEIHLRRDMLEEYFDMHPGVSMLSADELASVPVTVSRRMRNTVTFPDGGEPGGSIDPSLMADLVSARDTHVHWYGDGSVHGSYDIEMRGFQINNNFEWVRGNDGMDYETASSLGDGTYHRGDLGITAGKRDFGCTPVRGCGKDAVAWDCRIPVSKGLAPSGYGTLRVPYAHLVDLDLDRVRIAMPDQSTGYSLSYEGKDGRMHGMDMVAADIVHNVDLQVRQRRGEKLGDRYSVDMRTDITKARDGRMPLPDFPEDSLESEGPEFN